MQSQCQLPKVSTQLRTVLLESQLGSGSFFSENESLGINNQKSRLGNKKLGIIYTTR